MKVKELIEYLNKVDPEANVLADVKPWDEPLNLTEVVSATSYSAHAGEEGFIMLSLDTTGATRLDPNG